MVGGDCLFQFSIASVVICYLFRLCYEINVYGFKNYLVWNSALSELRREKLKKKSTHITRYSQWNSSNIYYLFERMKFL